MKVLQIFALCLALLLVLAAASVALAGSSARFDVFWQVFSGGGSPAEVGDVSLNGSIGQSVAGSSASTSLTAAASGYCRSCIKGFLKRVSRLRT